MGTRSGGSSRTTITGADRNRGIRPASGRGSGAGFSVPGFDRPFSTLQAARDAQRARQRQLRDRARVESVGFAGEPRRRRRRTPAP